MLVDLTLAEQVHYDHPRESREEVERRLRVAPRFSGENHLLVARDAAGHAVGVCWVVLFDPGPGSRRSSPSSTCAPRCAAVASRAAWSPQAVALLRRRHVSFA